MQDSIPVHLASILADLRWLRVFDRHGGWNGLSLKMSTKNRVRRLVVGFLVVLVPSVTLAMLQRPGQNRQAETKQAPSLVPAANPAEAVRVLQGKINNGSVKLEFEEGKGYIRSLLKALNIPVSSQALVFGRNSFQLDLISPNMPRALYFNDNVYVGFVQGGQYIEVASVDPKLGPVFFTLEQERRTRPVFVKQTSNCLVCHDSAGNGIPRLLVLSTIPDAIGTAMGQTVYSITDESPMKERFGGWYVTGTHGNQQHMGNVFAPHRVNTIQDLKAYIARMDMGAGANVTDLTGRFDTKPYLSPHSDIVAQMVLAHQTHVHNLISRAAHMYDQAVKQRLHPDKMKQVVENYAEPIVESMLFSGAQPFTAPIAGTTGFAAEFAAAGRRDSQGRSLKDLDLKTRLFKYPMSYLIYTDSFNNMPQPVKEYVNRRFMEILTDEDTTKKYAHLSASDRQAILEIMKETKR